MEPTTWVELPCVECKIGCPKEYHLGYCSCKEHFPCEEKTTALYRAGICQYFNYYPGFEPEGE